ncbi:hypothetical protein C0Q70_01125 [Pomacea canaliculata]|uniref:Uncharacterized protein n=1 Tax=Pomacea canaliculata TaxID=400727 RepID=A0A2T7PYN0_POMCA|nr:hypothetical protein C0Q70_01125 [Pomacea canaliculata]
MQSYRDRLEILTSVDRFLFRARKLVDINESTTISEDNFLLINESFKLMRSIRNKMRNNSENIAKIGFDLLEKLHARIPVAQSSSKRSLTRPEEDKALDVVVYEEKLLATHLPTWLKAVGMINALLEKSEKLTPYFALQKVLTLGKELLQNMSKAVKTCFDNKNKSEVINKKIEKQIELSKLYDKEMKIQQEELDNVTIQIAELRESQKKLEENIQYHQEVEKLLRRDSVTEEEKMKAIELIKQPDEAEPLKAETDESKAEKGPQEVLTLCERKLQLQKASANVLRQNVQKMEAIASELEILKEERMRKKQERIQFLEILEQPEKQEHPELTSSEQVHVTQEEGDASAVSSFTQDSSTTQEVSSRQTTVSSSESQPRGDKEPSSPDSVQRSTSSIRSAELETAEKTQAQLVLMTILNQLKEMKEFFVRMLASKEMVELAKQLDSLGCCETDADGVQTIKLSSPHFRNVLDHIQTILSKVLRSSKVSRLASKKTVAGNVINLTGSTAANEKRKELPIEKFSDLKMDLPKSWKEDLQNVQEAFAKGEIDRETYMEALVLMLKLAAVLQQKQALLGEGFLMDRLKQSLTAKIQKILEAVTSEHFPLYLLMKDADYHNYTAFLQQMNEEDRKIRLEQEKLFLFMKLEELYEKIRDRACRRKSRVNTIELVAKETQKKLAQLRVTQSLASYRPAPARLEDQTPTFFSFSQSGIPKVIRSLTKIQRQTILEEAEEVQDLVSETLASDYSGTISEEGKFSQQQKFDQKKLTKEEFTGASSPVLDIASQEATLPHLQKKPKNLRNPVALLK